MVEIGLLPQTDVMTGIAVRAYFKREQPFSATGFTKYDKSNGQFEGFLAARVSSRLLKGKFPELENLIIGTNFRYNEEHSKYMIVESDRETLGYEQGLRNGDILLKIDEKEINPENFFEALSDIKSETLKTFTVYRNGARIRLPVSIFYLDPKAPRSGMSVIKDPEGWDFIVEQVLTNSPADMAGLKPGDILLKENDFWLDSWLNYHRAIATEISGVPNIFVVKRKGKEFVTEVTPLPPAPKRANFIA